MIITALAYSVLIVVVPLALGRIGLTAEQMDAKDKVYKAAHKDDKAANKDGNR